MNMKVSYGKEVHMVFCYAVKERQSIDQIDSSENTFTLEAKRQIRLNL